MRHARVLQNAGARVTLVTSNSERRDQLQAEGWNVNLRDNLDYVSGVTHGLVASRTGDHIPDALFFLKRQIPTLVEKPLAPSLEEAKPLLKDGVATRGNVYCGYTLRFSRSLQRLRELLPLIGQPHAASCECRSYLPDWRPQSNYRNSYSASATQGGVLRDLSHELDYAGWILGWPRELSANLWNTGRLGIDGEEAAVLSYSTDHGCQVQIGLDYLSRPPVRRLTVYGSKGMLTWNGIENSVLLQTAAGEATREVLDQTRDEALLSQDLAFLQGREGPLASLGDALNSLAVCDAARRSSLSRKSEPVVLQ